MPAKQPPSYWVVSFLFWGIVVVSAWTLISAIISRDILSIVAMIALIAVIWFGTKGERIFMRGPTNRS